MKKTGIALMSLLLLGISTVQTGCFGSFEMIKKCYAWHDHFENKWVKQIVYMVIGGITFGISSMIDGICNLIEFWTGNNPLAMKEGERETQVLNSNGNSYEVTATRNNFHIKQLTGAEMGRVVDVRFNPEAKSVSVIENGAVISTAQMNADMATVTVSNSNGKFVVPANASSVAEARAMMNSQFEMAMAK